MQSYRSQILGWMADIILQIKQAKRLTNIQRVMEYLNHGSAASYSDPKFYSLATTVS